MTYGSVYGSVYGPVSLTGCLSSPVPDPEVLAEKDAEILGLKEELERRKAAAKDVEVIPIPAIRIRIRIRI